MSNKKQLDLIDRNALLAELDKFANPMPSNSGYEFLRGVATAITEVEDASSVNAIEVVKCNDCIYATEQSGELYCDGPIGIFGTVGFNDFCSCGEMRNNE